MLSLSVIHLGVAMGMLVGVPQQDTAADTLKEVKEEFLLWQARLEFAGGIREQVRSRLGEKEVTSGNRFQAKYIELQVKKLSQQHPALSDWQPQEPEQLIAKFQALEELVDVLSQVSSVVKGRMTGQQRKEVAKAAEAAVSVESSATFRGSSQRSGFYFRTAHFEVAFGTEIANWRGQITTKANAAFRAGSIGASMREFEVALEESWKYANGKAQAAYDRFVPVLVADGYVHQFELDQLIGKWTRVEVGKAHGVTLADCKDPTRVREVLYTVIDVYGAERRGCVAVYQNPKGEWLPSRDNELRGGFYDLRLAEAKP
jgi:hypothetical protein